MAKKTAASPVESYHSQHSPFGAFSSFTLGLINSPGGFGHALRGPAHQNIYIGFRESEGSRWRLLPFFKPTEWNESAFTGEAATARPPADFDPLTADETARTLGWASDSWSAAKGRFGFSILSPFGEMPDPNRMGIEDSRKHLSPHLNAWIEYDNTKGKKDAELVFGVGDPDRLFRPLEDTEKRLQGFAVNTEFGFATTPDDAIESRQGFDILNPRFRDYRGLLVIGGESGLIFRVKAGEKRRFPLVLGFYRDGVVSTGVSARYAYTRCFKNLEDVMLHGLAHHSYYEGLSALRDRELEESGLSPDQQFLIAQSTHSYFGSSQLLWGKEGAIYVVNEGEYRMMNTFDLSVDQMFFEIRFFPWAVKNILEQFVNRYSYKDRIRVSSGRLSKGGISFTHDMGVMHAFTPKGRSSYECENLTGCFSHMTMEQLLNWVLTAGTYGLKTGDTEWLDSRRDVIEACAESMMNRDHPKASKRNGILKFDSARCGAEGAEITTYDSLDVSLGQARNNLYLAVKTLGAWILLEKVFDKLGMSEASHNAAASADRLAKTVSGYFDPKAGMFPAVFEGGNRSRIIPAVEGFAYPIYLGMKDVCDRNGRFKGLMDKLSRHMCKVFKPGVCLDAKTGAWKISSTSTNTWFSKIALCQFVVRKLFPEALNPKALAADRVHADWQRQPPCGSQAMCDQIRSNTGVPCGSRYYPRCVTTVLWMDE